MLLGRKGSKRRNEAESGCGMGCLVLLVLGMVGVASKGCIEAASSSSSGSLIGGGLMVGVIAVVGFVMNARSQAQEKKRQAELQAAALQARYQNLAARFGDQAARAIMERKVWQGATHEMVQEAFGPPLAIDEKVLKTKTRHVYKYNQLTANRYGFKVTLENGVVVGWEGET